MNVEEFIECVKKIPMPEYYRLDTSLFKMALKKIIDNEIGDEELLRILDEALDIDMEKYSKSGFHMFKEEYVKFLADAIMSCKQYAGRYDKCRELEKNNAPPDEIEACYEVADKTNKPIFILPWA